MGNGLDGRASRSCRRSGPSDTTSPTGRSPDRKRSAGWPGPSGRSACPATA
jgi:hypothetical protein